MQRASGEARVLEAQEDADVPEHADAVVTARKKPSMLEAAQARLSGAHETLLLAGWTLAAACGTRTSPGAHTRCAPSFPCIPHPQAATSGGSTSSCTRARGSSPWR